MTFSFLHFSPFEVLGGRDLGRQLFPYLYCSDDKTCLISVRHGRAVVAKNNDLDWINIKGTGWTFGGPYVYRSTKDAHMMFGLMDEKDAVREKQVSDFLEKINPDSPKILGYKSFSQVTLPNAQTNIINIRHTNGDAVNPCVLYTKTKSPFRMADIAFFTDAQKEEILDFYCGYFHCSKNDFIQTFATKLAEQIGLYHKNNIINDSLYWDNITLCAEIIDYEWLTVPGMLLPNGQDAGNIIPKERKEKEIVYATEAVLRMAALFHLSTDFYRILDALLDGYQIHNADFLKNSEVLQRMLKKERFIY